MVNEIFLITGGTGTFGQHFARTLLADSSTRKVIIFSRDEQKQEAMRQQFDGDDRLRFLLGDVRNGERLKLAMTDVDVIVHAAALKIVHSCEYEPFETFCTNVAGTQNVIQAAMQTSVSRVLLLSTDKAVNPINLYGASKKLAEGLMVSANHLTGQIRPYFSVMRYGNVTGSRGSVIQRWKQQVGASVPLTVTDMQMTRFWITPAEAVAFTMHCLKQQVRDRGGYIYIPAMKAYRVQTLLTAFLKVAGLPEDYPVFVTGTRRGEKDDEEIFNKYERAEKRDGHFIIAPPWQIERSPSAGSLSSAGAEMLTVDELAVLLESGFDMEI